VHSIVNIPFDDERTRYPRVRVRAFEVQYFLPILPKVSLIGGCDGRNKKVPSHFAKLLATHGFLIDCFGAQEND